MIGERLQELRKDHKISQADFAKILGVSHYTVSSYECNRSDPDDKSKILIAKLFDVSIDYLLGLIDEPLSFNRNLNIISLPTSFDETDYEEVKNYINYLSYKKEQKKD
ncbi:MAG: helix-turn-helix transcriptional regulator [Ruminococcus sp.]|nr:helix-turn-helix transcriptional regulator [Ruminococcus sp.]